MNSAFFFKFLDSPNKQLSNATNVGSFKYEWDTVVDKEGSWALQAASSIQASYNHAEALKGDKDTHTGLFHKFLSAIHGEPYKLVSVTELGSLTDMADHYCALPAFSKSVLPPLLERQFNIKDHAIPLITIAVKLRHEILFQEAALFLAGDWTPIPRVKLFITQLDPRTVRAVEASRRATGLLVLDALQELLRIKNKIPIVDSQLSRMRHPTVTLPYVFSCIYYNCNKADVDEDCVIKVLEGLMESRLRLQSVSIPPRAGEGCYKNYFLCSKVADEDLPWDRTPKDF
ncbi:hypothetical protein ACEPPN_017289 [Leptodophora sp. 'Broadleaf-Isolate-01']